MALLGACLLGSVVGCASSPPPVRLLVEIAITEKANRNSPVPLTLVAVQDQKLFEKIVQMPAKEWYDKREQMRRDYPSGTAFTEWDWEIVPGQSPPRSVVEVDGEAVGAVFFANYRTPGDHRSIVGPQRRMKVSLGDEDLVVLTLDASTK
jgi:type VI secretion system protein